MGKYTVIYAEKYDVAVSVAAALGGIEIGQGKKAGPGEVESLSSAIAEIYKKKGYFTVTGKGSPSIEGRAFKITWGSGHFGELMNAKDYDPAYKDWSRMPMPFLRDKYEIQLRPSHNQKQFSIVKTLFTDDLTEEIYSMTDYEREGELIFQYTYKLTNSNRPCRRIKMTESTESKIIEAVGRPISWEENQPRILAAQARAIADAVVGWNVTAYETQKNKSAAGKTEVRKYGRVKTPVLYAIYEREKRIEEFKPKSVWQAKAEICNEDGECFIVERKDEPFSEKEECEEYIKNLQNTMYLAVYRKKEILEYAPPPYDTTTLLKEADIKGIPPKEAMYALEKLYLPTGGKAGYITYPRTDSSFLTEDKKGAEFLRRFKGVMEILYFAALIKYGDAHSRYFDNKKVEAHDAIILTGVKPPSELPANEKKIFTMIAKRMIALTYPPAKLLKAKAGYIAGKEAFVASGTNVIEKGYQEIFPKEYSPAPPEGKEGDKYKVLKAWAHEIKAKPPTRFTNASLLEWMQSCWTQMEGETEEALKRSKGIGRPSTRAAIIEALKKDGYVAVKGRSFYITDVGKRIIDALEKESTLKSPVLTAEWEQRLDDIEQCTSKKNAMVMTAKFISDVEQRVKAWVSAH